MACGKLFPDQIETIKPHVMGQRVHDLGAGTTDRASQLLALGATHVTLVEKEQLRGALDSRMTSIQCYFEEFTEEAPLIFLGWPGNYLLHGLIPIVERAQKVIYLGKNTDFCACGFRELFEHFVQREVLEYVPHRRNTLIIYGGMLTQPRPWRGEERAQLESPKRMWAYEELEQSGLESY